VITETKIIKNVGRCDYSDSVCTTVDHTRFYTDQDIDIFIFRSKNIHIIDGVIDIIQAASYSHSCIYLDANYDLDAPRINICIYGSRSKLRSKAHSGNGIYVNLDITTTPWGGSYGYEINGVLCYLAKAINVPALADPDMHSFFSIGRINCIFFGNKQDCVLHAGQLLNVNGYCQGDYVCTSDELPLYSMDLKCNTSVFDLMIVDHGMTSGGFYSPNHLINDGNDNSFVNRSIHYYSNFVLVKQPVSPIAFVSNQAQVINNLRAKEGYDFISLRDNAFICPKAVMPSTEIAVYDGSEYDFDTHKDSSSGEGLGPPLSLTITNRPLDELLFPRGNAPYIIFSNDNAGLLTDFIEIVLPLTELSVTTLAYIGIALYGPSFLRIQFIFKFNDETDMTEDIYPTDSSESIYVAIPVIIKNLYYYQQTHGNIYKIIIRLIGHTETNLSVPTIVHEVFGRFFHGTLMPLIDIAGGQTIYGTLAVNDGVKEPDLPVYADNAAAITGGLEAGDPYRTSTGIRMVVYD